MRPPSPGSSPLPPVDDLPAGGRVVMEGPLSRLLCDTGLVRVGAFRASPDHPLFADTGPIREPVFAFPRTAVTIQHEGRPAFAAGPDLVTFYNRGQVYRRGAVDPAGDLCEWFSVRDDALVEVLAVGEPEVAERPERPFAAQAGPSDPAAYLAQRVLVRHLAATPPEDVDRLAVEETVLSLLASVAPAAPWRARQAAAVRPAHRDLVERARRLLGTCFHEGRSLTELAALLGCSPFHLCRTFRAVEGTSLHQHRLQVRLRRSLERVAAGDDLAAVALDLGFASHSHFTAAFRRAFGTTPSRFRRAAGRRGATPPAGHPVPLDLALPPAG